MMDDATYHSYLIDCFLDAEDGSDKSRTGAQVYIDYYDGKQWTDEEVKELKKRGQPAITWNLTRQKIDYLQGMERTQRTKPRALPRTPQHEQDAFAATDSLQYVYDDTRYEEVRSRVWGDILKAGWGGLEIAVEQRAPDFMGSTSMTPGTPTIAIVARRCAWDRMFWDPYSSEDDFADASYLGLVIWMDRDQAIRDFGEEAARVFDETVTLGQSGGTYDDKPKNQSWVSGSGQRKRIRVVCMYYVADDGEWDYAYFTKGGILMSGPSEWVDEDGAREHPFCWRTAYVDRDNNRYGPIRDMVDLQDEVNKRRSKALHHFTARQTFGNQKFNANAAENKKQLARPDGHVTMQGEAEFGKDFGIIPTNDQAQGHFELLAQATSAFETVGPNAAMQGKKDATESGRAILAQQQGGVIQMGTLTDSLRQMDHLAYRKIWNRIRQFWTAPMWVRVTDNEQNVRFAGLNGAPSTNPETGEVQPGPPIAQMDVDIIIDDAPSGVALMDEQFQTLVNLKQFDVNNELPLKALITTAPNLRNKQELLRGMEEAQNRPPDPMQVRGAQAEVAKIEAEVRKTDADAALKMSQAHATMQPEAPQAPEPGMTPPEVMEILAKIDDLKASAMLKLSQAHKTQVDASLAPQQMAQKAEADRAKAKSMAQRARAPAGA